MDTSIMQYQLAKDYHKAKSFFKIFYNSKDEEIFRYQVSSEYGAKYCANIWDAQLKYEWAQFVPIPP